MISGPPSDLQILWRSRRRVFMLFSCRYTAARSDAVQGLRTLSLGVFESLAYLFAGHGPLTVPVELMRQGSLTHFGVNRRGQFP